jgi:hypothetical protein
MNRSHLYNEIKTVKTIPKNLLHHMFTSATNTYKVVKVIVIVTLTHMQDNAQKYAVTLPVCKGREPLPQKKNKTL